MSDPHPPQGPRQPRSPDSAERAWDLPEQGPPGAPQGYQGPSDSTPSYGTPGSDKGAVVAPWDSSPAGEQGGPTAASAEQGSYGTSTTSPAADAYAPTVGGEPSAGTSYAPQTGAGSMASGDGAWSRPIADPYGSQQPQQPWSQPGASPYDQPGPYPGAVPAGGVAPGQLPVRPDEEKLWGTLTHVGMILTGFLGPLIIYLVYKDRSQWIRANAAQSLNFSILLTLVYLASFLLLFVLGIGVITYLAAGVGAIVFGILAAVAANRGEFYTYPLNVSWVR